MKQFIGKLVVAIFTLFMVSGISFATVTGLGDNSILILLVIFVLPAVAFLSVMFTRGAVRSIGTAMLFMGFVLSLVPASLKIVLGEFQEAVDQSLEQSSDVDPVIEGWVQSAVDQFAFSAFWFGVIVGLFLMFGGYLVLTRANTRQPTQKSTWVIDFGDGDGD